MRFIVVEDLKPFETPTSQIVKVKNLYQSNNLIDTYFSQIDLISQHPSEKSTT